MVNLALWMLSVVLWSILLADTRVGEWITGNPVSRRYILPLWGRIRDGVQWVGRRALRVR